MKKFLFLTSILISVPLFSQANSSEFDQELADSLQADAYGMKPYVLAILKTGDAKIDDKNKINELFRGHMDNINRLVEENKLIVAGPLGKNDKEYRGIFIFDVKTIEEARKLIETDPAVSSGLLAVELYEWYGSAALPVYLDTAKKNKQRKPIR